MRARQQVKRDTRSSYRRIRKKRGQLFNLRIRLVFFVTLEMLFSIIVAYIVNFIINDVILRILNIYVFSRFLPFTVTIPIWIHLVTISLLFGIIFTFILSLWFLRPIKKLKKAIAKVADGDFSTRISSRSSSREIQEIYTGFNLMTEELEATEILQTDFVSNVSHEFKTPINAIEGYSMLLQDTENLTDVQKQYVDKILFNTQRLSTLTGSILLLSKIENQTINTDRSLFRLDEQIREAIVALEPLWEKKNVDFDVDMEDTEYFGNETLMRHVWSNLIGNAIKFGPENGTVSIRLVNEGKSASVTVDDEGEGLSEEALKHIFDKFYQGDSSHKAEGNGLGLTLVKKILSLEDGSISVENLPEKGCRFTVTLPKQKMDKNKKDRSDKKRQKQMAEKT